MIKDSVYCLYDYVRSGSIHGEVPSTAADSQLGHNQYLVP